MKSISFLVVLALASSTLSVGACKKKEPEPVAQPAPPPAAPVLPGPVGQAVEIAKAVRANPAQMASVLAAKGMTQAQFEDLMYRIAADPTLSKAYQEAMR